jgi:bilirubin oxidase
MDADKSVTAEFAALALPGGTLAPASIPKYAEELAVPAAMPPAAAGGGAYYEIAARQLLEQVLPATGAGAGGAEPFPQTPVWGYGSPAHPETWRWPACTIEAEVEVPVTVKWVNDLKDQVTGDYLPHLLTVDPTLHWANPAGPVDSRPEFSEAPAPYLGPVPLVPHLHGAHTGPESDGYPEAWWLPDANNIPAGYFARGSRYGQFDTSNAEPGTAVFQYPNDQRASTLWYHDHTVGMTRLNVYAGLAGFYLLRGGADAEVEAELPGPAPKPGDAPGTKYYEIPLMIQDRSFNEDGSLFFPTGRAFFDGFDGPFIPESDMPPFWNPEFFGNAMVVNGKTWPALSVEPRRYRFRLLNGCNARVMILKVAADPLAPRPAAAALPLWQIGNDGGLLPSPVQLDELRLAPGERADVVIDFSGLAEGTLLYALNEGPDSPYGGGELGVDYDASDPLTTGQVMQFRVAPLSGPDTSADPAALGLPAISPLPPAVRTRKLSLNEGDSGTLPETGPREALLGLMDENGVPVPLMWSEAVTETPILDDTEIWEIYNFTDDAHPIHLHLVTFEVVGREGIGDGIARGPEPGEAGRKDTVLAFPGEITRVKATFDRAGRYVWHCHILDHEDNEMMRPFEVVLPQYPLTLGVDPLAGGMLSADPAPGAGGQYAFGTVVALTATPAAGYAFAGWSGAATGDVSPVTVTVDAAKAVTALFTPVRRALTLGVLPAGGGTVSADPAPDALGTYAHGTVVTLTATPAAAYGFASWSGAASGAVSPVTVITDADKAVTANFSLTPTPELSVTPAIQVVTKAAGSATFAVANTGVGTLVWTAELVEGGAWARITAGASGSDAGTVTVGFDANPVDGAARTATVRITAAGAGGSPADVSVAQAANPAGSEILTSATVGVPFEMPLPPAFAEAARVTVRGLPTGLRFVAATRTIAGVPTRAGGFPNGAISAPDIAAQPLQITVEALPVWALGAFAGAAETASLGSGSASMSVSAAGRITGKIALAGTNYTFSAPSFTSRDADGTLRLTATVKGPRVELPLTLAVGAPAITDTTGVVPASLGAATGVIGADGTVILYRNVWKDAGMAAALATYVGYYTATLPGEVGYGSGYLTFTVSAAGVARTTGKLADGTAVSLSGPLILDEAGRVCTAVYAAPAAYKGGSLFGVAEFVKPAEVPVVVRPLDAEPFAWQSLNPQATGVYGEGFVRTAGLAGGFYNKLEDLSLFYQNGVSVGGVVLPELTAAVKVVTEAEVNGVDVVTTTTETRTFAAAADAAPNGLSLGLVGNKLVAPKADTPFLNEEVDPEVYVYTDDTNLDGAVNTSGLTMTFTRATGLFKGSFKAWFDYASVVEIDPLLGEVPEIEKHIFKSVAFQGVLTPVNEAGVPEGRGFFLWADKGVNPAATRPYAFNGSFDFLLLAN